MLRGIRRSGIRGCGRCGDHRGSHRLPGGVAAGAFVAVVVGAEDHDPFAVDPGAQTVPAAGAPVLPVGCLEPEVEAVGFEGWVSPVDGPRFVVAVPAGSCDGEPGGDQDADSEQGGGEEVHRVTALSWRVQ